MEVYVYIAVNVLTVVVTVSVGVAVLKNDIKWIKGWTETHEELDKTRFEATGKDIRELREQLFQVQR